MEDSFLHSSAQYSPIVRSLEKYDDFAMLMRQLLAQLLEDAYGRRDEDEQAEEEISQIRFYLHGKNIDVVDWPGEPVGQSGGEAAVPAGWFDMMPAYSGGTLRPALVADGTLLKKGLASAGRG